MTHFETAGKAIEQLVVRHRPEQSGHWAHLAPMRPPPLGWGLDTAAWLAFARGAEAEFNRRCAPPAIRFADWELIGLGDKPLVLFQLRMAAARDSALGARRPVGAGAVPATAEGVRRSAAPGSAALRNCAGKRG